MKPIKDNLPYPKSFFDEIPQITKKLADKTLGQLEKEGIFVFPSSVRETEDLTGEQMILRSVDDCYWTGNVMGFLGYKDERLTISSRFSEESNDYFLYYLLERVLRYPNVFEMQVDGDHSETILDLLVFLFPEFLKNAMRKGLFKTYIRKEYNNNHPRGVIDMARHIKENTPFTGNIAYNQREYSYDNFLMELIRHTIAFIQQKPYRKQLLYRVKDEVKTVVAATPGYQIQDRRRVLSENQKHLIHHAYYCEYRSLQQLCILILQNQKQAVGAQNHRLYGILFDGAWLWEEYVNLLIQDRFYHPKNKAGEHAQHLFYASRNVGQIFPDFIGKDPENRIIADAKYKYRQNIGGSDYLQVVAYMYRFDAKKGYYLYPGNVAEADVTLKLNAGSTYEKNEAPRNDICLIKHGLQIPVGTQSYREFCKKMQQAEKDFCKIFE